MAFQDDIALTILSGLNDSTTIEPLSPRRRLMTSSDETYRIVGILIFLLVVTLLRILSILRATYPRQLIE